MKQRVVRTILVSAILAGGIVAASRFYFDFRAWAGTDDPSIIDIESDPKDLIRRSLEAYGGIERIKGIRGLQVESTIILYRNRPDPLTGTSVEYFRFPDRLRAEVRVGFQPRTHIYDGLNAWTIIGDKPEKSPDYVAEGMRTSIKTTPILLLQEALDERSILDDIVLDKLDGKQVLVVPFNDSSGAQYWLWFNSESFLLERLDYTIITSQGSSVIQVKIEKYQEIDGIQTASEITFLKNGSITQETRLVKATYNPDLPDSLFTVPEPKEPNSTE